MRGGVVRTMMHWVHPRRRAMSKEGSAHWAASSTTVTTNDVPSMLGWPALRCTGDGKAAAEGGRGRASKEGAREGRGEGGRASEEGGEGREGQG